MNGLVLSFFVSQGRNVVLEQSYGAPKVTKDGVTVAKSIEFKDRVKNIGASLVKQVANATNDVAGDGTPPPCLFQFDSISTLILHLNPVVLYCTCALLMIWASLAYVSGTTCATILTRAIYCEGCKSVAAGMNAMDLRRGISMAIDAVVTSLKSKARMISTSEEIAQVLFGAFYF